MTTTETSKKSFLDRALTSLEVIGNRLPDPVFLFFLLCIALVIISHFVATAGVSVVHPSTKKVIHAVSLLETANLQMILSKMVANFQGFPPLGLVLVTMLGVGVAEQTGMMEAAMKHTLTKISPKLVTLLLIFIGICANCAGDAGNIVLPPLAASIFLSLGRHPLAGMFVAFASVTGGFAANVIIGMTDVLAAAFTIPAAQIVFPEYHSSPAMNYYFIALSVLLLGTVGYLVNEHIVEKRLGKYEMPAELVLDHTPTESNPKEGKALKLAGLATLLYIGIIIVLSLGDNAFLADPKTKSVMAYTSPMMQGIVPLVLLLFLIPGLVYGMVTGSIKSDKDVVQMMSKAMSGMGSYIVLAFVASQFLAFFSWSNLGVIIAVKGAEFLSNAGFVGISLILCFIFLSAGINIFIGSASAKWAIMAPVFVPMFMLLGYDPALTQMAYRIGDSLTNPISPLYPYLPIIIAFAQKYDPKYGLGTIIANMLPYSLAFAIVWPIMLILFIIFNLPLGPDGFIFFHQ